MALVSPTKEPARLAGVVVLLLQAAVAAGVVALTDVQVEAVGGWLLVNVPLVLGAVEWVRSKVSPVV